MCRLPEVADKPPPLPVSRLLLGDLPTAATGGLTLDVIAEVTRTEEAAMTPHLLCAWRRKVLMNI